MATGSAESASATLDDLNPRTFTMAMLRIVIGWHFLYEGYVKLALEFTTADGWSSKAYLESATGPLAEWFHRIAANPSVLNVVDGLNAYGLVLIGACLILGLATRFAAVLGVLLLSLYYLAYPPFFATAAAPVAEGKYLLVNKTLVELAALCVVLACPARAFGIDALVRSALARFRRPAADVACTADADPLPSIASSRRQWMASLVGLPLLGGFTLAVLRKRGYESFEETALRGDPDATSGATVKRFDFSVSAEDVKDTMPTAQIGDVTLSRMILGGNLMGGWAHARDLIYVSKLVRAYHNEKKIFQTLQLAEACGVNTVLTNPALCGFINNYWSQAGGKIQFISDCGGGDILEMTRKSIDNGACACYVQGGVADKLVGEEKFDVIADALELIRKNRIPAGIGGHHIATIEAFAERGLVPDFWMKTLHHGGYWSATEKDEKDNIWCEDPDETIAFMNRRQEPWIAFKTLAAGALQPFDGFKYAFENGADFICVGMYDFQIVEDVNIAMDVLGGEMNRRREWIA